MKATKLRRYYTLLFLIFISFFMIQNITIGQRADFLMEGWYWGYPKTCEGAVWADTLMSKANDLGEAGITYVWLPPMYRAYDNCAQTNGGYDPMDLYDLGEFGQGVTHFGARNDVDQMIAAFESAGINAVADVILNHRHGGELEPNPAVKDYIENFYYTGSGGTQPYPANMVVYALPIGGSTGRAAGDYYIKVKSKTGNSYFYNINYQITTWTDRVSSNGMSGGTEGEPNGGGECGEPSKTITLGYSYTGSTDNSGCGIDEFKLNISSSGYNSAGDYLYIHLPNTWEGENQHFSDQTVYEIYYNGNEVAEDYLLCMTWTDFTAMPSGQGAMNFKNFKPNGITSTNLNGDIDFPNWFYDYEESSTQQTYSTRGALADWADWLWEDVGVRGYRVDAVKHFEPSMMGYIFNDLFVSNGHAPGLIVGEWVGTTNELYTWVSDVKSNMSASANANIDIKAFDFPLRFALKDVCDNGYDARNIFTAGTVNSTGLTGENIVTFIDNHDFGDRAMTIGPEIINNKELAYTYILTDNQIGLPMIYYKDYYNYNLKSYIDPVIAIHNTYIYGSSKVTYLNKTGTSFNPVYNSGSANRTLLYQLKGSAYNDNKEVVVAINFSTSALNVWVTLDNTSSITDTKFSDVSGNAINPTTYKQTDDRIQLRVPAQSYAIWVEGDPVANPVTEESDYSASEFQIFTGNSITGGLSQTTADDDSYAILRSTFGSGATFWGVDFDIDEDEDAITKISIEYNGYEKGLGGSSDLEFQLLGISDDYIYSTTFNDGNDHDVNFNVSQNPSNFVFDNAGQNQVHLHCLSTWSSGSTKILVTGVDYVHLTVEYETEGGGIGKSNYVAEINPLPSQFMLNRNYPNPFNPSTHISFSIPENGYTTLKVYNSIGQEISNLISQNMEAGKHSAVWNAYGFSSGIYFCELTWNGKRQVQKMVLTK